MSSNSQESIASGKHEHHKLEQNEKLQWERRRHKWEARKPQAGNTNTLSGTHENRRWETRTQQVGSTEAASGNHENRKWEPPRPQVGIAGRWGPPVGRTPGPKAPAPSSHVLAPSPCDRTREPDSGALARSVCAIGKAVLRVTAQNYMLWCLGRITKPRKRVLA